MDQWLYLGEMIKVNSEKFPNKMAVKDETRALTFKEYHERSCRLANGLMKLGISKGDRTAIISQNCIEWMEIYAATAKSGIIAVPINWRLTAPDIAYIINDSDAKAFIVQHVFVPEVEKVRKDLKCVKHFIYIGPREKTPKGWVHLEDVVAEGGPEDPKVNIQGEEIWIQLYTSGTTGKPKGVLRSHRSYLAFFLLTDIEFQFHRDDIGMFVMPLCHVNSTFFSFDLTYIGASVYIFPDFNYKAERMLEVIDRERITFTSLVPTHYALILSLPEEVKKSFDGKSVKHLLCSSAPVRQQTKRDIMKFFPNAKLFEAYGSTEAGLVTLLRPEEQLTNLGSVGKENVGTPVLKILDEHKRPVPEGDVGELYSKGPMIFTEYYHLPEKTKEAFTEDGFFTAGDMARKNKDGYYYIVDRKANMIITGGEHVYPTEVEEVVARYPGVFDLAVIGTPHEKWGEQVTAIVVVKEGVAVTEEDIVEFCKDKLASFKRPKRVIFIKNEEMPRTTTGKILHRVLRERYGK